MKKALITFGVGEFYDKILSLTLPRMKEYALKHNYDVIVNNNSIDSTRPLSWSKVKYLINILQEYDYVLWLDCDIVIKDYKEDIFDYFDSHYFSNGLVRCYGKVEGINCGVWLVSRKALDFLNLIWTQTGYINDIWWEQSAAMHLMGWDIRSNNNINFLKHPTKFYYETQFFSDCWNNILDRKNQKFIHFCGYSLEERLNLIKNYINDIGTNTN